MPHVLRILLSWHGGFVCPFGDHCSMETKRLELLLLAGCSCLLTLLCQPIAQAVATPILKVNPALETSAYFYGKSCSIDFQRQMSSKRDLS
jgi:hypothetical protein